MPAFGDETLHDRYAREHADHMARLAKMMPEQIAELELSLHNALAEVDRLRAQAQAAPEAESVEVVASAQKPIAILNLRDLFPSAHWSEPEHFFLWQITPDEVRALPREDIPLYTAPQHDAELVERERANAECFRQIATDLFMKVLILTAPGDELRRASADALERIDAKLATLSAKS